MEKFYSTKVITLGSTAFRQPFADSHCRFIHGYNLTAKFYFQSDKLDSNNWVVDFGSLKKLKKSLEEHFDHKLIISQKDPHIDVFKNLHTLEIVDLIIMEDVSIEMFASFCLYMANNHLVGSINSAECYKVEVYEHEKNSGIAELNY